MLNQYLVTDPGINNKIKLMNQEEKDLTPRGILPIIKENNLHTKNYLLATPKKPQVRSDSLSLSVTPLTLRANPYEKLAF